MEKYDIRLVEQPLERHNLEGMAQVAAAIDTPILADESVFTLEDAYRVIIMGAADVINVKLPKAGGIHYGKKIAALAEASHRLIFVGSMVETGIGASAHAHYYVSTPNLWPEAAFMQGPDILENHLLREDPLSRIRNGCMQVPEGPGLGIELDEQALKKLTVEQFVVK